MVNKQYGLPDNYKPTDLVYPDVRFTFKEKIEKRMMRSEAAKALEKMFAGAEEDGIYLAGVSAYRSQATQTTLYNRYVERDGKKKPVLTVQSLAIASIRPGWLLMSREVMASVPPRAVLVERRKPSGWPSM